MCEPSSRSSSAQKAWIVPRFTCAAAAPRLVSRRCAISPAALFVNVNAQMRAGSKPEVVDQEADALGEAVRLSCAGPGEHELRPRPGLDRLALRRRRHVRRRAPTIVDSSVVFTRSTAERRARAGVSRSADASAPAPSVLPLRDSAARRSSRATAMRRVATAVTSSTARLNAASLARDGLRRAAQLPNELQRRRANLVVGGGRFEVGEHFDVSAHGEILSRRDLLEICPVGLTAATAPRSAGSRIAGARPERPRRSAARASAWCR